VWLLIGWREIDPVNLSWLSGDPAQYEIGWEFLRHESIWHFPPTWISHLDYPTGVTASYLDFIPLAGVIFHLFSPLLPANFQYLGLYAVSCYVLQAYFGLRLVSLFAKDDRVLTTVGAAFFLLSPILTERLSGHFPHSTHWVIVACLYYYFRPGVRGSIRQRVAPFVILAALAASITPYIALMANAIGAAAIFRAYREELSLVAGPSAADSRVRATLRVRYLAWAGGMVLATFAAFVLFGFIVIGDMQLAGDGYTAYSLNLVAPINPQADSLLIRTFPTVGGQAYESYNYLGLGILFLLLVMLARKPQILREVWSEPVRPLAAVSVVLILLAISTKVTFANVVLLTVPLPKFVFNLLASFRASARLFWPVHYLLILAAIAGTAMTISSRTARRLLLASALLLQYFDLLPLRNGISAKAREVHGRVLPSNDWAQLAGAHKHLIILPALQCGPDATPGGLDEWPAFARLVARNGMTLNSVYVARISPKTLAVDCVRTPEQMLRDGLQKDTAYILSDRLALAVLDQKPLLHYCRRVDGFNLCTYDPSRSRQSQTLAAAIGPIYQLGGELRAEEQTPKSMLLENFDWKPGWGRWSTDHAAAIYFRLGDIPNEPTRLELVVSNVNVTKLHPVQRAFVSVNGQSIGVLTFRSARTLARASLEIAPGLLRSGKLNVIRFELPDAAAPNDLGVNGDPRLLALYLHRLRIVAER
jgi:hypothetical protein